MLCCILKYEQERLSNYCQPSSLSCSQKNSLFCYVNHPSMPFRLTPIYVFRSLPDSFYPPSRLHVKPHCLLQSIPSLIFHTSCVTPLSPPKHSPSDFHVGDYLVCQESVILVLEIRVEKKNILTTSSELPFHVSTRPSFPKAQL